MLAVAVVAGAAGAACAGPRPTQGEVALAPDTTAPAAVPVGGGGVTVALADEVTGLNPLSARHYSPSSWAVARLVWPEVYRVAPDLSLDWVAVEGAPRVVSDAPFTVEWRVRPSMRWDDGSPVGVDDFRAVWLACNGRVDPGEPASVDCADTSGFEHITAVEAAGDGVVRAVFDRPWGDYATVFHLLVPAHVLAARGPTAFDEGFGADAGAAAGPYRLREWVPGERLVVERNPAWSRDRPRLDTVTFVTIADAAERVAALGDGAVDVAAFETLDRLTAERLAGLDEVLVTAAEPGGFDALVFRAASAPLAEAAVRSALARAVDREALVAILGDQAVAVGSRLFAPADERAPAGAVAARAVAADPAAARAALEGAGWAAGPDGVLARDGVRLALRLLVRDDDPARVTVARAVAAQLGEVGAAVDVVEAPADEVMATVFGGASADAAGWDLAVVGIVGVPAAATSAAQWYGTGGVLNAGGYSSAAVDDLLARAQGAVGAGAQGALLTQAEEQLAADPPNVALYGRRSFVAHRAGVANVVANATIEGFTWGLTGWARVVVGD